MNFFNRLFYRSKKEDTVIVIGSGRQEDPTKDIDEDTSRELPVDIGDINVSEGTAKDLGEVKTSKKHIRPDPLKSIFSETRQ